LTIIPGYPPVINSPEHAAYSARATCSVVGKNKVQRSMPPSMAAEDFAFMLQELPGAYIWIGNGEGEQGGCMLHNAHYDFNDDVAPLGASYWVSLVQQRLA
jgi:metal-dependent amidase/aminoacylase/carboxypeptidase family protein